MGPVQTTQCLYSLYVTQFLINKHRVQQWLVETCLVLVGYDQYVVKVRRKEQRQSCLTYLIVRRRVHGRLCVFLLLVENLTRESHQWMNIVIALLLAVGFDGHIVAHSMSTAGSNHHSLCLSLHGM